MLTQIRTISLWQWWATAMALGIKKIETRGWPTNYRGPLAIHASKRRIPWDSMPPEVRKSFKHFGIEEGNATQANMPQGAIVCVLNVIDCKPAAELLPTIDRLEELCGGYDETEEKRFGWVTADVVKLEKPIVTPGRQRVWHITPPDDFELRFIAGNTTGQAFKLSDDPKVQVPCDHGKWVRK